MKPQLKILFIIVILTLCLVMPRAKASAACQLTGVWTSTQTLVPGQSFPVTVNGQNCANQNVTINVYGQGGTGQFLIKSSTLTFPNTTPAANGNITVLATDITGRTADTTASLKATSSDGSSTVTSTSTFIIKAPVAGSCQLSSAQWQTNFTANPILGSPLHMVVNGAGCAGFGVSFKIYSDDWASNYEMGTVNGTFNSTGTVLDVVWNASNANDSRPLSSRLGNYNFYFWASAGTGQGSNVTKVQSSNTIVIPANSQGGCVSCNNVLAPDTCTCADGFSGPRGSLSSCDNVCQSHIGDALGGNPSDPGNGTKYKCNSSNQCVADTSGTYTSSNCDFNCVAATAPQSYNFSIDNPLAGGPNDLFDIINIVTQWIMYISVPLAVLWIMYAGFLMLTAGPKPENFQKGRDILKYAVLGLAIIFIGKGFVSLIISVIELGGGTGTTPPTTQEGGLPGNACGQPSDCKPGLACNNGVCQYPEGNGVGYPCISGASNCAANLACDDSAGMCQQVDGTSRPCAQTIDGRAMGTCVAR